MLENTSNVPDMAGGLKDIVYLENKELFVMVNCDHLNFVCFFNQNSFISMKAYLQTMNTIIYL